MNLCELKDNKISLSKSKKKILIVFGTRPEAIKMAPLFWEFSKYPEKFQIEICITRQHQTMLDQVIDDFELKPKFELVMEPGHTLESMTGTLINQMKKVFDEFKPDLCFVHGDTTTSFSTALSAFYSKIDVVHIEAGLRTYDSYSPWPEEMNRQLIGRISKYHFAPTERAKKNILIENPNSRKVILTGNTVIDALFWILNKIKSKLEVKNNIISNIKDNGYSFSENKIVLITCHRRENHGSGLENICKAIKDLSLSFPEIDFIFPVHLNPKVKGPVAELLSGYKNIFLIQPLNYLSFVFLMSKSYLILTDSGGIQEEAPSLNVPVLVLRENSERPEAIVAGAVKLVGTEYSNIVTTAKDILENELVYKQMTNKLNPYGDGQASVKIVKHFMENDF